MRGLLRGTLYCVLWYGSIVAGFLFIACPMLPLLFFSPPKFRKCGDLLLSCWELYSTVSKTNFFFFLEDYTFLTYKLYNFIIII